MSAATAAGAPGRPAPLTKRKRASDAESMLPPSPSMEFDPPADQQALFSSTKRVKTECGEAAWPQATYGAQDSATTQDRLTSPPSPPLSVSLATRDVANIEAVKDVVQFQFSQEILIKHNELRLIEQEMAKCQIALEQLRRCHLIPYPTDCPTPAQMLDIASGRGTAVRPRPGATVPKWSSPFGVVDGPYARHYAKWLIPDPVFDGPLPNWPGLAPHARSSKGGATADARSTRNSVSDSSKARASRGVSGQRLHSLSSGYPQPKDKAGPCILKRSDGKVVKLVCTDCHRDNFSSTQGFINHCRIAHKRDYKSHDEAAIHCGHPIEVDTGAPLAAASAKKNDATAAAAAPKSGAPASIAMPAASAIASASSTSCSASALATPVNPGVSGTPGSTALPGHVYSLARADSNATDSVLDRIHSSYASCSTATAASAASGARNQVKNKKAKAATAAFVGSDKTPFLSRFLEKKEFGGNLDASVEDAKEVTDIDDMAWYADEDDEFDLNTPNAETPNTSTVKRAPVRPTQSAASSKSAEASRPSSSKGASTPAHIPYGGQIVDYVAVGVVGDAMDVDLSPIHSASNIAPSLVSDDGEYDDSDDGSASETSDTDMDSVSEVPEINTDEDEDHVHNTPRPLRRHSGSVKLKKDDPKHVTFVSPVKGSSKGRRN
ncbi:ADA HAT complex component 1 [Sporothrix brasiliensis 5110]|uniref:ADA HAT complex component 1 n=1 Tax=Sporothrix brasiliensis 5110 TaxID=1398154 RepID=A0A0C2EL43_9PEZI|nr:ADA HAT complex component 1 [Sporothrix brasiliensis 5110]KIH86799.1 ADA HAT complex component 1 [Sporothrix brasiliensis 5110]